MSQLVLGIPPQILNLVQDGLLERSFHDGLFPALQYRGEAQEEEWEANTGTEIFMSRPGLLAPITRPIAPGQDPQPQTVAYEQWAARLARYAGTINDEAMIRREEVDRSGITAPVLILHGRDDALVSFSHAEHAGRSIKGARLQSFDSGGHGLLPQISSMRRLVREFLATATSKGPGEALASPQ